MDKPASIQSLPNELIDRIGSYAGTMSDVKALRLSCRTMGAALQSAILKRVVIDLHNGNVERNVYKLETLSAPTIPSAREDIESRRPWKLMIRELEIKYLTPLEDFSRRCVSSRGRWLDVASSTPIDEEAGKNGEKAIKENLLPAIVSLEGLSRFRWTIHRRTPMYAVEAVATALREIGTRLTQFYLSASDVRTTELASYLGEQECSFPILRTLSLEYGGPSDETREPDRATRWVLGILKNSSSKLTSLTIRTPNQWLGLHDIVPFVRSASLESVTLTSVWCIVVPPDFRLPPAAFRNLRSLNLTVCTPDDRSLFAHLRTPPLPVESADVWTALRNAGVWVASLRIVAITDPLLDYLTAHSGPLEHLTVVNSWIARREQGDKWAWVFYESVLPRHKAYLRTLKLDTAALSVVALEISVAGSSVASQEVKDGGSGQANSTFIKTVLDCCANGYMPNLTNLKLYNSEMESTRGSGCGTARINRRDWITGVMAQALERYTYISERKPLLPRTVEVVGVTKWSLDVKGRLASAEKISVWGYKASPGFRLQTFLRGTGIRF
ncbi:hypothetical protein CC1G_05500 [Coprinopsis cinerea okayama7|uniref:F-box domain-containing protein n=1 Tax=Coprinopsis cinerea (strain Okayama-7 / 130 / ATCC MYA-4618 / FGSC 9003) TaxID=240176 RepID=A8P5H8_COPC7|nr:hypothetical protein CC1G_05500 [Coprinopsis cinerea okayama7\|eukprot:XP_001838947.2 hypothetical protein CC1G_05500 [Coprinopsis cinerea okayama7\